MIKLEGNGIVGNTTKTVRGIFDKVKRETQRLVLQTISALMVCWSYLVGSLLCWKNEMVVLSNTGSGLKMCADSMRCAVTGLTVWVRKISGWNIGVCLDTCTAKGCENKCQKMEEENARLRQKVSDLETLLEMQAKAREEGGMKASASVLRFVKDQGQRLGLLVFSLVVMCFKIGCRCKEQAARLSRKSREMRQFMNLICTLSLDIQSLRKDNKKMAEEMARLRSENMEYAETIKLMQQEMELGNDRRSSEGQVEEVKNLIAMLMEKDAELNLIVQNRARS